MEFLHRHRHDRRAGRALAELYREHSGAAYKFAFHLTGSREDAEDLVQVAFLQVHRTLASGEQLVNPRAWLATVIRRLAANVYRDRREDAASDRLDALVGGRDHEDHAGAELQRIRVVLHSLPEAQHQAFVLRYWSDLSYREIASVLETTESAVESLLVRARAAVVARPEISEECIDVHRRLSAEAPLAPLHERHLGSCRSCQAAQTRLARAAGIAAAAALIPRVHVAQALAAAAPGFTVAGATGAGAAGGTSAAAGKAAVALKAALVAGAVAGSVAGVHARLNTPSPRHGFAAAGAPAVETGRSGSAGASGPVGAPVFAHAGRQVVSASEGAGTPHGHEHGGTARHDDGKDGGKDGGGSDSAGGAQQAGDGQDGDTQSSGGGSDPVSETGSGNGSSNDATSSNDDNSSNDGGSSNDGSSSGGGNDGGNN